MYTSYSTLAVLALTLSPALTLARPHGHGHAHGVGSRRHHSHHVHHVAADGNGAAQLQLGLELDSDDNSEVLPSIQHNKRAGLCAFPYGAGMVAVTPGLANAGWAMSPDQPCLPGMFCPYACQPGYLMAQWDPAATSYTYPASMNGGLKCNLDGSISTPFPNKPYCVPGTGTIGARNAMGANVAFCQTVLPGNEAMLIPTNVDPGSTTGLAVPDLSYWAATAAHYYINPAGVSPAEACVWGTVSRNVGNWSPYVAGANTDASGNTFVKVGWNPIYFESDPWRTTAPNFAVMIECVGGGCNGIPCRCDPSIDGLNKCSGGTDGAGGAAFCVATVPAGSSANVVVYPVGGNPGSPGAKVVQQNPIGQAIVNPVVTSSSTPPAPVPTTTSTTSTPPPPPPTTSSTTTSSVVTTSSTPPFVFPSISATSTKPASSASPSGVAFVFAAAASNTTSSALPVATSLPVFSNYSTSASAGGNVIANTLQATVTLRGGAGMDNLAQATGSSSPATTAATSSKSTSAGWSNAAPVSALTVLALGLACVLS